MRNARRRIMLSGHYILRSPRTYTSIMFKGTYFACARRERRAPSRTHPYHTSTLHKTKSAYETRRFVFRQETICLAPKTICVYTHAGRPPPRQNSVVVSRSTCHEYCTYYSSTVHHAWRFYYVYRNMLFFLYEIIWSVDETYEYGTCTPGRFYCV